jgi:hypothetical protein
MPRTRILRDAIIQISLVWFHPPAFVLGHRQQEEEQENRSHEPELQQTPNYTYFHLRSSSFPVRRPPQFAQLIEPATAINK